MTLAPERNLAMRITILDDYQDAVRKLDCFKLLDGHEVKIYNNTVKGVGQLAVRLRDTEVLVLIRERTSITRPLLDKLPKLRMISQTAKLGSHIDLQACAERGIHVAEGHGNPVAAAELTWALIMSAMRRIPQYANHLKHGAWQQSGLRAASMPALFGLGRRLEGRTLGLLGYGRVAQRVARYGQAFGMQVLVHGNQDSLNRAVTDNLNTTTSIDALFQQSDVLSIHRRLHPTNTGCVTLELLSQMKPDALFVNTARAELVQPDAIVMALNRGRPGMAAIDVFESEPILQGHTLLRMENAICTPHIGFVELETYEAYFREAFENVLSWLAEQNDAHKN